MTLLKKVSDRGWFSEVFYFNTTTKKISVTVQIWGKKIKYGIDLTIEFNNQRSYTSAVTFQVTLS